MGNKMLIDAAHPEETRVVVCHGNRVEEFDFESAAKQQLRGNIYLAKVTRVEPSLQAAFVDYGGNRHGFLAFNEIHPDYYQIPVADREALIAEQQEETSRAAEQDELDDPHISDDDEEIGDEAQDDDEAFVDSNDEIDDLSESEQDDEDAEEEHADAEEIGDVSEETVEASTDADEEDGDNDAAEASAENDAEPVVSDNEASEVKAAADVENSETEDDTDSDDATPVTRATEDTGLDVDAKTSDDVDVDDVASDGEETEDAPTETDEEETDGEPKAKAKSRNGRRSSNRRNGRPRRRPYKIQEVIKRRQILLVQVVKEERGNKGAALTTYLSLAGRYCVLMPNTARGGGISRKITNARDRKRLKGIANELEIPKGMGLIIRTAGANRTKSEIRRDFDYLMRLWENVRDLTLESTAPTLVHEEGSLVKRSIRDLYSKEIESVLVEGEEGYKDAKGFMRMLMPSHAKNVKRYKDRVPLFQRYQVEQQLDSMFSPTVELPSGGYIVINPTEALVSIDVNSGRATREHNIEDTALKTNLEAAEEVSRQLRLRDMAGLVVIDFIDMEDNRNNRAVEKKLKECLRTDRARIQVGRISMFGLLEMSRQRMRSGVLEGSTNVCPHCEGTGLIRSVESTALYVLRAIEEECLKKTPPSLNIKVPNGVANYIVNQKREDLLAIEERYGVSCFVEGDGSLTGTDHLIDREGVRPGHVRRVAAVEPLIEDEEADTAEENDENIATAEQDEDGERNGRKRRRRRRRKGKKDGDQPEQSASDTESEEQTPEEASADAESTDEDDEDRPRKRRRRGKRGGRRNRSRNKDQETAEASSDDTDSEASEDQESSVVSIPITTPADFSFYGQADDTDLEDDASETAQPANGHVAVEDAPAIEPVEASNDSDDDGSSNISVAQQPLTESPEEPVAEEKVEASDEADETPAEELVAEAAPEITPPAENKPRRRGWWQRRV